MMMTVTTTTTTMVLEIIAATIVVSLYCRSSCYRLLLLHATRQINDNQHTSTQNKNTETQSHTHTHTLSQASGVQRTKRAVVEIAIGSVPLWRLF